ncbi:MAG: hypothetical protein AAF125_19580, partial [Chloroflexota bacterium]
VLMGSMKPQLALFVYVMLALNMIRTWQPRRWMIAAGTVLTVVTMTMLLYGERWITHIFTITDNVRVFSMNASLVGALARMGLDEAMSIIPRLLIVLITLWFIWYTRDDGSREKYGSLIAAGLLVAPYAAGNSGFTILALGVIPLFQRDLRLGGFLVGFIYLPYLVIWNIELRQLYEPYYWTTCFFVCWIVLGMATIQRIRQEGKVMPEQLLLAANSSSVQVTQDV